MISNAKRVAGAFGGGNGGGGGGGGGAKSDGTG